ncbi:unnamed protein product, partial [Rotaria sordida]
MIERQDNLLSTYVYHKPTDTGYRAVRICSSDLLLKKELDYYRKTFLDNGYPPNVIKKAMRKFELNKNIDRKQQTTNVDTIYISIPYY